MRASDQLIDDLRLLEPPEPFRLNPWFVGAALIIAITGWWLIRRHRATQATHSATRAGSAAYEDALAELERLFALIDREESRPYAIESSAIIRRYIETRFALSAPRQSTEEFLLAAQHSPKLATEQQAALGEFLRVCDLLKFARTLATRAELERLHSTAVGFVKRTHAPEAVA